MLNFIKLIYKNSNTELRKKDIEEGDAFLNENDLLKDIFSLNDLETDTVKLNFLSISF